jgi:hypothetical protein
MKPESEVKGIWFVTARSYVLEEHGPERLAAMAAMMDERWRSVLREPLTSVWYPEQALSQALAAMCAVLANGSQDRFTRVVEDCTAVGVSRFFKVMLLVSSARFALRQVPTMWRHIRRGAGRVEVADRKTGTLVAYREFPYFDDPNYRSLTLGSLTAMLRICTRHTPQVTIRAYGKSWLDVEVVHD